jgi:phosphate acetyltransferase
MKSKSLYISSHEKGAGSLIVSMGLMEFLKGTFLKVAFFRPFVEDCSFDFDIDFFISRYKLDIQYEKCYGYSVQEAEKLIAQNKVTFLIEELLEKYKQLEENYDFVIVEGLYQDAFSHALDIDINLEIAKNFGTLYCVVLKGDDKSTIDLIDEILIESQVIKASGCGHFATFVNRLDEKVISELATNLQQYQIDAPVYLLKEISELNMPTIADVQNNLGCTVLLGDKKDFKRIVKQTKIAAMQLEHFLEHLEDGDLIIVPGDRADIIVGAMTSIFSKNYPNISGILLTGGIDPASSISKLLDGFTNFPFPIIATNDNTYQTALKVSNIKVQLTADNERKIALAMGLFNSSVDVHKLRENITNSTSCIVTPVMFEYSLFQKARENKKRIVLPEAMDERILRACEIVLRRDVVDIILLGDEKQIRQKAGILGLDIEKATIINPQTSELKEEFGKTFYDLRKHKGISYEAAYETISLDSYFGTMMVYMGLADGMVSGAVHTTQETIKPALQIIKTKPNIPIVSSLFFMCLKTQVLVYADCAVNQDPDAMELAIIAISSANSALQFGITPKIAMLSYSTGNSGKGKDVEKVIEATKIVKELRPDLLIEGPVQYDVAVDSDVAKIKSPNSCIAGEATIFIFPDLNTGNNTYKAVQRSSGAVAIGPILQGLKKPINDLSRGCLVPDIVNTIVITAIQATEIEG